MHARIFLLFFLPLGFSLGQMPSSAPFLRIETGFHHSKIWRMDLDAAHRWLVTASSDKTARIWDLRNNGLAALVFRPPVGSGDLGALYGAAITPDGNTVACGALNWQGAASVYLFDRASGTLLREIVGIPRVPSDLDFSPDGSLLAAGMLETGGVGLFRVSDGVLIANDYEYGGETDSVEFDPSGTRLAAASLDGTVRLYRVPEQGGLQRLARAASPGGKQPHTVSFSPDGRQLAVAFWDSPRIDRLSSEDLGHRGSFDTEKVQQGNLNAIAWSADGRRFFAGGSYMNTGGYYLRTWDEKGRSSEFLASGFIIRDLRTLPSGGVLCAASDPFLAAFASDGKASFRYPAPFLNFYFASRGLQVSKDGGFIQFPRECFGLSPARFRLDGRSLTDDVSIPVGPPPRTEAGDLVVSAWEDAINPTLNGRSLGVPESCRSLSIDADGQRFVLGTDRHLRCFDRSGNSLWIHSVTDAAWAVQVSGDGKLVVATLADGTVRWYRHGRRGGIACVFPVY